ncbi:hypothetical protein IJV79_00875, partial [bacterium]|nr:hypothetical protein [bacterium]
MDIEQKTLNLIEFDKVLEKLSGFAYTSQSKELCRNLEPRNGFFLVNRELQATKEAKEYLDNGQDIPIEFISDMSLLEKPSYFNEDELIEFAKTLRSSRVVKNFLKGSGELSQLSSSLFADKELEEKIFETFDEDNRIKKNATEKLAGLHSALKDTETTLRSRAVELLNLPSFSKYLQENIY